MHNTANVIVLARDSSQPTRNEIHASENRRQDDSCIASNPLACSNCRRALRGYRRSVRVPHAHVSNGGGAQTAAACGWRARSLVRSLAPPP